jgi:CRP/FNR family transcriptional regulator, cyclic AMP receptor protein
MNMDHQAMREAIVAGDSDASVRAHLEVCTDCTSLAEELDRVDLLTGSLVVPAPSAGIKERIRSSVLWDYECHRVACEALFAGDSDASVRAHLEMCTDCTSLAEELDRVDLLTGSLVVPPPSAGLKERVLDHVLVHYDRHTATREVILAGDSDASVCAHLEVCKDCTSLTEELDRVDLLTGSLIVPPPSAGLKERIRSSVLRDYDRHRAAREAIFAGDSDASVRAHLEVCADCTSLAEELDRVDLLAGSLVVPPPSAGLQERVLDHVSGAEVESPPAAETLVKALHDLALGLEGLSVTAGLRESLVGFLATLTREECDDLVRGGRPRRFARGATVVEEGEVVRRVAAILRGRVKVSCFSDDGRETVLEALGPGDLIGEVAAIDGEPCSATVTALEPVEAVVLSPANFVAFLDAHPRVTRTLLVIVTRKLRDANHKRIEFGTHDTEGRVARRLVELAHQYGSGAEGSVRITLPLSQQELAGWTCSSRQAVSKALRSLRACGLVETHRRGITVLDLAALARRAGLEQDAGRMVDRPTDLRGGDRALLEARESDATSSDDRFSHEREFRRAQVT